MAAQVRLSSTAASLAEGLLQRIFEAEANEQPVLSLEELARAEVSRGSPFWLGRVTPYRAWPVSAHPTHQPVINAPCKMRRLCASVGAACSGLSP